MGVLCLSLFWYALLCVLSRFAIILKWKIESVALLLLSIRCPVTVNVLWFFLTVLWVGLQCVVMVFLDHSHLLFASSRLTVSGGNMLCPLARHFIYCLALVQHKKT